MTEKVETWLRPHRPNPYARLRLFCFPHAGAGVLSFRPWSGLFPAEIELCPVQLPGREDRFREPAYQDAGEIAAVLARVLYPYQVSRPFAFFGHSMGAIVAFELAHHMLRQYGVKPMHLFVSARCAPQWTDSRPPLYSLPDPEFKTQLKLLKGTPEELLDEADPAFLQLLRADFAVNETYHAESRAPLDIPLTAFAGRQDPRVTPASMDQWKEHTSAAFRSQVFEGGHFFTQTSAASVTQSILLGLSRSPHLF